MVDQLLCFFFCQRSRLHIPFNIAIQEGRNTAHTHCRAVLSLDCCQIAKIQPLYGFFGSPRRAGDIIAINGCHFFHLIQRADLIRDLLPETEIRSLHTVSCIAFKIILFLLDQVINPIQCHSPVIAYDTPSSVSVRKSGDDFIVACFLHLRCIDIKHSLIMRLMIFSKYFMQLLAGLISVGCAGLLCHLDASERHKCTF